MNRMFSLFIADLCAYWGYYVIAICGVGAAVAGVVWTHGSFATKQNQLDVYAQRLLGPCDVAVGTSNPYLRGRRRPASTPTRPSKNARENATATPAAVSPTPGSVPPDSIGRRGEGPPNRMGGRGGPPDGMGRRGGGSSDGMAGRRGRGSRGAGGRSSGGNDAESAAWAAQVAFPVALAWLQQHPDIDHIDKAFVTDVVLRCKRPWTGPPLSAHLFAVDPATFPHPDKLPPEQWLPADISADDCIVLDRQQADRMEVTVGETVGVTKAGACIQLKVCGISENSRPFGIAGNAYVTPAAAARILGTLEQAPSPTLALISLKEGVDVPAFSIILKEQARDLQTVTATDITDSLRGGGGRRPGLADMNKWVVVLSLVASLLIVFTTLNLGLAKRLRQFGMLRAVGATRGQITQFLLLESTFMGFVGSVLGIPLGYLVLVATASRNPALFPNGAALNLGAVVYAFACGLGGSLGAALLPAIVASRQSPLGLLADSAAPSSRRSAFVAGGIGVLLLLPALALSMPIDMPAVDRGKWFGLFALPAILLGEAALVPVCVLGISRLARHPLATLMQLPAILVDTELRRHLGRGVAVAMAVAAGFGSFVAVSTWGSTMLKPFLPNQDCPDLAVTFRPNGLPPEAEAQMQSIPYFKQCLPVYTRQFHFGPGICAAVEKNALIKARAGGAILVGVNPNTALLGEDSLFSPNLMDTKLSDVIPLLEAGTHCLVPSSFAAQANLHTGDTIDLGSPADPGADDLVDAPRRFVIAGIYTTPWHLLTKKAGMRGLYGSGMDVQAMIIVNDKIGRSLARDSRLTTFWANYTPEVRKMTSEQRLERLNAEFATLAKAAGPSTYTVPGTDDTITIETPWANVGDMGFVIEGIHEHAGNIIGSMAKLPLWSLLVAALAVGNTVIASMRIRRWSLGVMRSLGMTRGQLGRLIVAEALLIAICGCAIGLAGGLYAGWVTARLAHYVFHFSGITIEMVVPWGALCRGVGIALTAILPAAVLPAVWISRQEPLDLLLDGSQSF